jgi:hypothetical protein
MLNFHGLHFFEIDRATVPGGAEKAFAREIRRKQNFSRRFFRK